MREEENNYSHSALYYIMKAAGFMLILLLALSFTASAISGVSFFNWEIMRGLRTIFVLSLIILGVLFLIPFTIALLMPSKTVLSGRSTLVKDYSLRYEYTDENNRKKKRTFSIKNIDDYLAAYQKMFVINDVTLYKENKKDRLNANTLYAELPDGKKLSMRDLNNEKPMLYDRIAAFLYKISDKSVTDMAASLKRLVARENMINLGKDEAYDLKVLKKSVKDPEVKEQIDLIIADINRTEVLINVTGTNDKIRKLYEHYLPMLREITQNYLTLEAHDLEKDKIEAARVKLMETFRLIEGAFNSLTANADEQQFDELEATVATVSALLEQERSISGK
ncbi:MAG: hypothetical protein IK151_08330 [Erysipelotrichaceae bacterium]|nr:hypothetical protein [Erysipelotrichaceae bacterium]